SPNHKWEFLFCEISYGPYSFDWKHYWKDELRLGKFSKDSWNSAYFLTQRIDASDQLLKDMMDELNHVMIHFYETNMDIYILDRKTKPCHRMCLIKSLEIPLINSNEQKTIHMINKLCKGILMANKLIVDVIRRIEAINQLLLNSNNPTTPPNLVD
ncbi:9728_t:CDS:1, partial [Scutellospora calospora]